MVPEESPTMVVKPVSKDPRQMVADIAEMMVKRRIGVVSTLVFIYFLTREKLEEQ